MRNQRRPELNLKGSYGLNGLGNSPGTSWEDVERQTEPSWYIGAEFHIPLAGGIRSRNELVATRLELESSELALRGLQVQLMNADPSICQRAQPGQPTEVIDMSMGHKDMSQV